MFSIWELSCVAPLDFVLFFKADFHSVALAILGLAL